MFYLALGIFIGGLIMYYIQPAIKDAVAHAFSAEAKLAAALQARADKLKTVAAKSTP